MRPPREIELKFLCAPEQLGAVLAAAPAGDDETKPLKAVYFDTADGRLRKAGASLRVRESKGQRVQTLKLGSGFSREEHETVVEQDRPDPALGPLPRLLDEDGAKLQPAFEVEVTRRQRRLVYGEAEIELALDEGEVRAQGRRTAISEVELELLSGPPSALFDLSKALSASAPLYLSMVTKSDRGAALAGGEAAHRKAAKLDLTSDSTTAEAFQAIARDALARICTNGELLRTAPTPDALHQLRVAARTLRSALSTFADVVRDEDYDRLKGELRWLAKACDHARNLDVFAEETLPSAEALHPPPHGLASLTAAVEAARREATDQAIEAVSSAQFRTLALDLAAWIETDAWIARAEQAPEPAQAFGARALAKRRRKLLKRGRRLEALDDEARHEVRIEGKKLRYAAEAFAALFSGKASGRFIAHVKDLQEELGALNDLATAEQLVESLRLEADAAFAAGELVGLKAARKRERIHEAAEAIKRLKAAEPFWNA